MITRFAPSPTGPLHLGHAYSALTAYDAAKAVGGTFLLRIEDTDSSRARRAHEDGIIHDLKWLGCVWPDPPRRQSDHMSDYTDVLETLAAKGLVFPCDCNRRKIIETGAGHGPDGPIYPGTCAARSIESAKPTDAIRLNWIKAAVYLPDILDYTETGDGGAQTIQFRPADMTRRIGAPILRRSHTGDPAYHLACCHDDALQGITHVIRGQDCAAMTPIHVALQHLMGWPTPMYHHHPLVTDDNGKRLAKIDKSRALATYRADGKTPADIRAMTGLPPFSDA